VPGSESWCCRLTPAGRIRVALPQLALYGRYRLGEDWLRTLVAAYTRRDDEAQRRALDALAPVVEAVASYRCLGAPARSLFASRRTRRGLEPGYVELDRLPARLTAAPELTARDEELKARLDAYDLALQARRAGLSKPEAELFAALVADPELTPAEYSREHRLPWTTAADILKRVREKLRRVAS
jgi:hypothetical protein